MERIGQDMAWLWDLQERVDAGAFASDAPEDPADAAERLEIGWAVVRPAGRRFSAEWWHADAGRWYYDSAEFVEGVRRRIAPANGRFTLYRTREDAYMAAKTVDETNSSYIFAVILDKPKAVVDEKRTGFAP